MLACLLCINSVFAAETFYDNHSVNNTYVVMMQNAENQDETTRRAEETTFAERRDAENNPENPVTGKFVPVLPLLIAAFIAGLLFACSKKQEKIFKL